MLAGRLCTKQKCRQKPAFRTLVRQHRKGIQSLNVFIYVVNILGRCPRPCQRRCLWKPQTFVYKSLTKNFSLCCRADCAKKCRQKPAFRTLVRQHWKGIQSLNVFIYYVNILGRCPKPCQRRCLWKPQPFVKGWRKLQFVLQGSLQVMTTPKRGGMTSGL